MKLTAGFFYLVLCTLCALPFVYSSNGFDLSYFQGDVSQTSFNCLAQSHSFGILQATKGSSGTYNPYIPSILKKARASGLKYIDIYIFPHYPYDPVKQVNEVIDYIQNNGAGSMYDQIWVDIEARQLWGPCNENVAYIKKVVAAIQARGRTAGIYSNWTQWAEIMCGSTEFSHLQLWYPHYDNSPSFSDFKPFGGWSRPAIKQHKGTTGVCGTSIDLNWYP